jgi:hypothetical protein
LSNNYKAFEEEQFIDDFTVNLLPFLKLRLDPGVRYGHVGHLGLLHLLTVGVSSLLLKNMLWLKWISKRYFVVYS